ncbi:tRNA-splicing endonuclease subunit [Podospora pseudoanserina]|uniref:tRNA-splicing endonuclease subunit Sen34 n=1 Tax=Podospora pseudoanserina TaxID=2609844 RepID=A0ABR0HTK2_9PEZI|nr:tRNA-splicing endonuclease subunit [Podospora pseudoanserina]
MISGSLSSFFVMYKTIQRSFFLTFFTDQCCFKMATSTSTPTHPPVRISLIAGRYLVFDIDAVMVLRRSFGLCGVLTGTMPQNPTQNLFLSMPQELRAEEARLVVDRGAGYVADEAGDHLRLLKEMSSGVGEKRREGYLRELREKRVAAKRLFDEEKEAVRRMHEGKRGKGKKKVQKVEESGGGGDSLFETATAVQPAPKEALPAITPSTSNAMLDPAGTSGAIADENLPEPSAFYRELNKRGYFTTPGLRFGGGYSVYPSDPFKFHAHYLSSCYGWDEKVPMLDIVTSGRLGTAVKKSFMFGAEMEEEKGGKKRGEGEVRMFCVEWAGM